jgi:hypothetical protein
MSSFPNKFYSHFFYKRKANHAAPHMKPSRGFPLLVILLHSTLGFFAVP